MTTGDLLTISIETGGRIIDAIDARSRVVELVERQVDGLNGHGFLLIQDIDLLMSGSLLRLETEWYPPKLLVRFRSVA